MTDTRVLTFPPTEPDDDRELAERIARGYAALPSASTAQIATCTAAVLAEAGRASAPRRAVRWWWGAAAAAALVMIVARPWRGDTTRPQERGTDAPTPSVSGPVGSTSEDASGAVHFELTLPRTAREVAIVGDFNGWDERATPMVQAPTNGEWSAKVALPPGRHVYAFVVDGAEWLIDSLAPQVPDAGYGPANALIVDPR